MKTKDTLDNLKVRLEKIEALKSVGVNFQKKRFSKATQEFVRSEIQAFLDKRIQEIDDGAEVQVEAKPELSDSEVSALKLLAARVLKQSTPKEVHYESDQAPSEESNKEQDPKSQPEVVTAPAMPMAEALRMNAQLQQKKNNRHAFSRQFGKAVYKGQSVEVLAKSGDIAVIRGNDGNKIKVAVGELR
jgi:hypothetical protein